MIFVREEIKVKAVDLNYLNEDQTFECSGVHIVENNIMLVSIYRAH